LDVTNIEDDLKRDMLLFDLIKRRYDSVWDRITNLDSKANNLMGFVSVVIGLLLGPITLSLSKLLSYLLLSVLYFSGIGLLLISIGIALYALKIKRWDAVPDVQTLLDKYTSTSYYEALIANRDTMADAVLKMEKQTNSKAKFIGLSWYLLIAGLVGIFMFIVLLTGTGAKVTKDG
jgi:hypothetical protein